MTLWISESGSRDSLIRIKFPDEAITREQLETIRKYEKSSFDTFLKNLARMACEGGADVASKATETFSLKVDEDAFNKIMSRELNKLFGIGPKRYERFSKRLGESIADSVSIKFRRPFVPIAPLKRRTYRKLRRCNKEELSEWINMFYLAVLRESYRMIAEDISSYKKYDPVDYSETIENLKNVLREELGIGDKRFEDNALGDIMRDALDLSTEIDCDLSEYDIADNDGKVYELGRLE